jgi:DNA polymerase-3 subunit alpha (Gram-positive type)
MAEVKKTAKVLKEEEWNATQALLRRDSFVVLDIETTGLSPDKGGFIIELAGVKIEGGVQVAEFSTLIDPRQKLYGKTIELTGITNEMVEGQPTYSEVLPKFFEFIGDSVIVAHNAMFDWNRFLTHYFSKLGLYPTNESICTKKLFQKLDPGRKKEGKGYTLSDLVVHYDVAFDEDNHHRALDDTIGTALAFLKMRQDAFEKFPYTEPVAITEDAAPAKEAAGAISVEVTRVQYWEKKTKTKQFSRIYVGIRHEFEIYGNVYYDLNSGCWFVKNFEKQLNFNEVEEKVLAKVNQPSMEAYLAMLTGITPKKALVS